MSRTSRDRAELRALNAHRKSLRALVSQEWELVKTDLMPGSLINRAFDRTSEKVERVAGPAVDRGVELADRAMAETKVQARSHPLAAAAIVGSLAFLVARPFLTERNDGSNDDEA